MTTEILMAALIVLWTIVQFLFAKWVKRIEDDVKEAKMASDKAMAEYNSIKVNYIERFNTIERLVTQKNDLIADKIDNLKDHFQDFFVSKEFCKLVQKKDSNGK